MNPNELWLEAVLRAVGSREDSFKRRMIRDLLHRADGDAGKAVKLMGATDASFVLGNFGACMHTCRIWCMGNAASHPVEAWIGPDYWRRPPDLVIPWREIFQYVEGVWQPRLL